MRRRSDHPASTKTPAGSRHAPVWPAQLVSALLLALVLLVGAGCSEQAAEEEETQTGGRDAGVEIGAEAPDVRLKNQDQETVVLSDYAGERNVVIVFFPMAFTPV